MTLFQKLTGRSGPPVSSWEDLQAWLAVNGHKYPTGSYPVEITGNLAAAPETADDNAAIGCSNPIVGAAIAKRSRLFSQWRPHWVRPDGNHFTDAALRPIQQPRHLKLPAFLDLVQQHDSLYGAAYIHPTPEGATLLSPPRVRTVLGAPAGADLNDPGFGWLPDATLDGYLLVDHHGKVTRRLGPDEVFPFYTFPDPVAWWRGCSWVTALLRDIQNDGQATQFISNFFAQGSVQPMVVRFDPDTTVDNARAFKKDFLEENSGLHNMHKPKFIGGGADLTVVGSKLGEMALRDITGAHETRISMRSEVPAVVLGARESLSGSSLTTGNYNSARRLWGDLWGGPYLDAWSCAIQPMLDTPGGPNSAIELGWDQDRVLFFQEDTDQIAQRKHTDASSVALLVRDGWQWEEAVDYVHTGDIRKLVHSGLLPVQVHPPGEAGSPEGSLESGDSSATDDTEDTDDAGEATT